MYTGFPRNSLGIPRDSLGFPRDSQDLRGGSPGISFTEPTAEPRLVHRLAAHAAELLAAVTSRASSGEFRRSGSRPSSAPRSERDEDGGSDDGSLDDMNLMDHLMMVNELMMWFL